MVVHIDVALYFQPIRQDCSCRFTSTPSRFRWEFVSVCTCNTIGGCACAVGPIALPIFWGRESLGARGALPPLLEAVHETSDISLVCVLYALDQGATPD